MFKRRTRSQANRISTMVWLTALAVPSIVGLALGWRLTHFFLGSSNFPAFQGMNDQIMYFLMFGLGWFSLSFGIALIGFSFTGFVGMLIASGYREVDEYPSGPALAMIPLPSAQQKASLSQAIIEDLYAYSQTSPHARKRSEKFLSQGLAASSFHLRDFHWVWDRLSKAGVEGKSEKLYEELHDWLDGDEDDIHA